MSHIVFFEKPGCGGNARQRALLEAAGHTLERRNLLTAHWTRESLLDFLWPLPVAQWFNRAAPRIKSGEIDPDQFDADAALALLLADPLLIRRPLMQREDGERLVGFDTAAVERFVGLHPAPGHAAQRRHDDPAPGGSGGPAPAGRDATAPAVAPWPHPLPASLEGCAAASPQATCRAGD